MSGLDYTPEAIANLGIPIPFAMLDEDGEPKRDASGAIRTETLHLKFDAAALMSLEAQYRDYEATVMVPETRTTMKASETTGDDGETVREYAPVTHLTGKDVPERKVFSGVEAMDKAYTVEPTTTVIKVLATGLGRSVEQVAATIDATRVDFYWSCVELSLKMAQGLDPTRAAEAIEVAAAMYELNVQAANAEADTYTKKLKMMLETATMTDLPPGSDGSASGSSSSEDSTSS